MQIKRVKLQNLLFVGLVLLASIANGQESKLSYSAMVGVQDKRLAAAAFVGYDLFSVQDVFGVKGLTLRGRSLGGVPLLGRLTLSGGGDICLTGRMGSNAEGSFGIGVGFVENQKSIYGVTLGVKIFTTPAPVASAGWVRL